MPPTPIGLLAPERASVSPIPVGSAHSFIETAEPNLVSGMKSFQNAFAWDTLGWQEYAGGGFAERFNVPILRGGYGEGGRRSR